MIHSLNVQNIALIDELNITFSEGLNVLSGETGAGKSIIVGSMNLVLGERADRELIRNGKDSARVEAVLYVTDALAPVLEEHGIDPCDELVVSRELSVSGKNVCRINGSIVNLSTLKGIMDHMVDLLGQHEHQSLLYTPNHLALIDSFGGEKLFAIKMQSQRHYIRLKELVAELNLLGGDEKERKHTIDLLEFQINELSEAQLAVDEMTRLTQERDVLANAQSISAALEKSYDALYVGEYAQASAVPLLKEVLDQLASIAAYNTEYSALQDRLRDIYYTLEELSHDVSAQLDGVFVDEERQNEVEGRIDFLNHLFRKYDVTDVQGLVDFQEGAQLQLEKLLMSDELTQKLTVKIQAEKDALYDIYTKLSAEREKAAYKLTALFVEELSELGMRNAQFDVKLTNVPVREETKYSQYGPQTAEFYISTNVGEPLKPLSKTASGGEISRIMLAFKNITAQTDHISTVIFDEIDTGISGVMAHVIAQKMASIAQHRQVICVTHLPQIAAMGDRNFLISKKSGEDITNTEIQQLGTEEKLQEIARLSGGIHSETSMQHARELIQKADITKQELAGPAGK